LQQVNAVKKTSSPGSTDCYCQDLPVPADVQVKDLKKRLLPKKGLMTS